MEIFLITQAFHGKDLLAHSFHGQRMARIERCAINQHAACTATGPIAAAVSTREPQLDGNHFPQGRPRLVLGFISFSVDIEDAGLFRHRFWDRQRGRFRGGGGVRYSCDDRSDAGGRHGHRAGRFHEISARVFHL